MANKINEIFNPNSNHNKALTELAMRHHQTLVDARSCYVCKTHHMTFNAYSVEHYCEYLNSLPPENTCFLWEEQDA